MNEHRLFDIINYFKKAKIAVIGDFFLDLYHLINNSSGRSIETGKKVYSVYHRITSLGGAGNIVKNISSLGAEVFSIGVIGDDGNGYDLLNEFKKKKINITNMITSKSRVTPTYLKPVLNEEELERQDIKELFPLTRNLEERLYYSLKKIIPSVDCVIISDQVQEKNLGIITDFVKRNLESLAITHKQTSFIVDSRERLNDFNDFILKSNEYEINLAVNKDKTDMFQKIPLNQSINNCNLLYSKTKKPVYLTMGKEGILCKDYSDMYRLSSLPVPIVDIVGAGDSMLAGIAMALSSGASYVEAAQIGTLTASITLSKKMTGEATYPELIKQFNDYKEYLIPQKI